MDDKKLSLEPFEIESLNVESLNVEELEQRLEMTLGVSLEYLWVCIGYVDCSCLGYVPVDCGCLDMYMYTPEV